MVNEPSHARALRPLLRPRGYTPRGKPPTSAAARCTTSPARRVRHSNACPPAFRLPPSARPYIYTYPPPRLPHSHTQPHHPVPTIPLNISHIFHPATFSSPFLLPTRSHHHIYLTWYASHISLNVRVASNGSNGLFRRSALRYFTMPLLLPLPCCCCRRSFLDSATCLGREECASSSPVTVNARRNGRRRWEKINEHLTAKLYERDDAARSWVQPATGKAVAGQTISNGVIRRYECRAKF